MDSVTESGIEDGWADKEGLNRARRGERYGRYLWLGGGERWHGAWFGVSKRERRLVLDYWEPRDAPDRFIRVPEDVGFDEMVESVTTQVREVAEAVADSDTEA